MISSPMPWISSVYTESVRRNRQNARPLYHSSCYFASALLVARFIARAIIHSMFKTCINQVSTLGFAQPMHLGGTWTITAAWRDPEDIHTEHHDDISPFAVISARVTQTAAHGSALRE